MNKTSKEIKTFKRTRTFAIVNQKGGVPSVKQLIHHA